jgi:hypothetical protein
VACVAMGSEQGKSRGGGAEKGLAGCCEMAALADGGDSTGAAGLGQWRIEETDTTIE